MKPRWLRSLGTRMLVIAFAQAALLAVAAVVIFAFTRPPHPDHHHHHPPEIPGALGVPPPGEATMSPPPPELRPHEELHSLGPLLTLVVGAAVLAIGSILTARWIVRPIEQLSRTARALGEGRLGERTGVVRDDELGQLGGRIDEMAEQIERMLANERELLANVAHELRTPLSRIGVALDLAGEGDSARARASLGEIAVDVGELEQILDDVLTAFKYDASRGATMLLRKGLVTPAEIANASAARLRSRHPERPLELVVASELPDIAVDPVMFRRVIDNLLENSHKYTPDPATPIVLAVRAVDDARGDPTVEFEVRDRGIGIATADLPNIYTAFYRAERSRSRETGGVGLGLTLSKRIVEAHGGSIDVTSSVGDGTRAVVTIDAAKA